MTPKWNAHLYDQKHDFVSKFGGSLVDLLAPQINERVLDVGCGTGDLAHEIATHGAHVQGIDASHDMIIAAQQKYPDITFHTLDATALHLTNQFEAVFSNAALHWMKHPDAIIKNIYSALKQGGRFIAEMGGHGNIASIVWALQKSMEEYKLPYIEEYFPWYFPTLEEYQSKLEGAGFTVDMISLYERPTPLQGEDGLRNWLVMFSTNMLQHLSETEKEQIYAKCEQLLKPMLYQNHQWVADYRRLRFVAIKK
ncbi:methyltransferase type 11 [Lysinibacillus sphaericus]|uniref:class I SAM-dependent methyltransferase n=1 Tax=Lysinibacillus sphaericus TaxID=1421 RepID=UPI0018CE1AE4|nr:class I SAM-dependent methyltransferase [Lysinibacillus sphaericus]MBG9455701.1 methyltransferase type 11 [Lysinibacillus sphaericus]MBG9477720.1 methyltransferase type 11 [Lysinibacillus sphaericus]MBG9593179.1 methyltransferase type 11 [Lysinibacillus sphaericus]